MYAIEVSHLTKAYPSLQALNDINFRVSEGSIHGFLGPNGAGKTTTFKILAGLLKKSSGQVSIFGSELETFHQAQRSEIGFLPENPPLYTDMKVRKYLEFVGEINGFRGKELAKSIDEVIDKVGLNGYDQRLVGNLSKGYKQRVGLAQTLVYNPRLLILDEPSVGLDPKAMIEIRQLIKDLKEQHTIIISSHLLHEISQICDEVTLIEAGNVLKSGDLNSVLAENESFTKIVCKIEYWQESWAYEMDQLSFIHHWDVKSFDESAILTFYCEKKPQFDPRRELTQTLIGLGIPLLEFKQEQYDLEEFFLTQTNRGEQEAQL